MNKKCSFLRRACDNEIHCINGFSENSQRHLLFRRPALNRFIKHLFFRIEEI